jgi:hypothetical protein
MLTASSKLIQMETLKNTKPSNIPECMNDLRSTISTTEGSGKYILGHVRLHASYRELHIAFVMVGP